MKKSENYVNLTLALYFFDWREGDGLLAKDPIAVVGEEDGDGGGVVTGEDGAEDGVE